MFGWIFQFGSFTLVIIPFIHHVDCVTRSQLIASKSVNCDIFISKDQCKNPRDFVRHIRESEKKQTDLIFILDRSTGVGDQSFYLEQKAIVYEIIKYFTTVGGDNDRIAIITFGIDVTVIADGISDPIDHQLNKCQLLEENGILNNLTFNYDRQVADGTNIKGALDKAREIFEKGSENRKEVYGGKLEQLALLFSDGEYKDHESPLEILRDLRKETVKVSSVGVGDYLDPRRMEKLTTYGCYANASYWLAAIEDSYYIKYFAESAYIVDQSDAIYQPYSTKCKDGSTGVCDIVTGSMNCDCLKDNSCGTFCSSDPCQNEGECIQGADHYMCKCPRGYTGHHCEVDTNECINIQCEAEHTHCVQHINYFACICDEGFCPTTPTTTTTTESPSTDSVVIEDKGQSLSVDPKSTNGGKGFTKNDNEEELWFGLPRSKVVFIFAPGISLIVIVTVLTSVGMLYSKNKKANTRGRAMSDTTDTTSIDESMYSKTISMISFSSQCYKEEGTPAAPKVKNGFSVEYDSMIYGNEPICRGMDEWYHYAVQLNELLSKIIIVRLDGERYIMSPDCKMMKSEIEKAYQILHKRLARVVISFQYRDYGIVSNDGSIAIGQSTDNQKYEQEVITLSRTRQYVIISTAIFKLDKGHCKRETEKLSEHIKKQGL